MADPRPAHPADPGNHGRLGVVDESGRGTPADVWTRWSRPFESLDPSGWDDVLVVAPHPDDEVLGVGGLMARCRTQGARVRVLAVTDGDAAYPGSPTLTPARLAAIRVEESAAACAVLGVAPPLRLGVPDGAVARHEDRVRDRLVALLAPGTVCLATWSGDGHPDHEAGGRAARSACAATGAVLVEYPVWTWHWSVPDDPAVPWSRAAVLRLTADELADKRRAVDCFVTQVRPLSPHPADAAVLPPFVVDRLLTPQEMVFS